SRPTSARRSSVVLPACLMLCACVADAGCGSSTPSASGGSGAAKSGGGGGGPRAGVGAPAWFTNPPKSASSLFFVGDATGSADEGAARDAAKNKALAELTTFCGAQIKSEGQSIEREANGKYEQ